MSTQFEHLFSPVQVGPMRVPNRICETTTTINSSQAPGLIDDHFIAHHAAKARGGTGWIGSETWLLDSPFPPEAPDEVGLSVGFASHWAAYQNPAVLLDVDARLFGEAPPNADRAAAAMAHVEYIAAQLRVGVPLHAMTRHMLGLFNGMPGGRAWRRTLSERAVRAGAGVEVVLDALAHTAARAELSATLT